jgi:hypothetical protein
MIVAFTATRGSAYGDDLKLKDGLLYREVQVVEARPDALIVKHKSGMVMVAFDQLPPAIRKRYRYDPTKASEYRAQAEAAQKATEEANRRLLAAHEQRKFALATAQTKAALANTSGAGLVYNASAANRPFQRAVEEVGAEIERAQIQAAREAEERSGDTFLTAPFWQHPMVQFIGGLFGGGIKIPLDPFFSEPRNWR